MPTITLPADSRRMRLLKTRLAHTTDLDRAQASRWTWGARKDGDGYDLTVLGVLNTLIGLVVWLPDYEGSDLSRSDGH